MKFCKDCKNSVPHEDPYKMTCASPHNIIPTINDAKYLVTGIGQDVVLAMRGASCTALRRARDPATEATVCGPDGKWFEVKE